MAEDFTAKFKVDISDLKKNITEATKTIKLADATFKASTAGMDDWKNDADGLSAKLKQLSTVLEAQKSKLESYRQQLQRQQAAYEENGSRAEQLKAKLQQLASSGVDKASDEYKKYESALKAVLKEQDNNAKSVDDLKLKILNQEAAVGKTEKEIRQYNSALNNMESELKDVEEAQDKANASSGRLGDGYSVLKNVVANLVTDGLRKLGQALKDIATDSAEYADEILTMSKTTSLSTDTLQKFDYMADLVDVDLGTVAGSLKRLTKNMDSARDGSGSAADAFATLGVSVTNADGSLRDNEDTFYDVIDALGKVENETERDALAMAIFGKSATDLNPLIEAGADALAEYAAEAENAGYIMDEEMLGSLGELQDSFDRMKKQTEAIKHEIAAGFADALTRGTDKAREFAKAVDWKKVGEIAGKALGKIVDGFQWILTHGKTVAAVLGTIMAVIAAQKIMSIVQGIQKLVVALKAAAAAAAANPYVLLAAALAAVVAGIGVWNAELEKNRRAQDAAWQKTNELADGLRSAAEEANAASEAYADMTTVMEDSVSAGMAQTDHLRELKDELIQMTDANGQVTDSERARAEMILGELNSALGTEYTMTGNVIDQYGDLVSSIDDLIQKKQALLIVEAEEEAYKQAIIGKADAEAELMKIEEARIPVQEELAQNQAKQAEILGEVKQGNTEHLQTLGDLAQQEIELKNALAETNDEYEASREAVAGYAYDIEQYTANATAAINGDYDSISHKAFETALATGEASMDAADQVTRNVQTARNSWMENLNQMVSDATGKKVEFKDAGGGMVQAYVDGQKYGQELPREQVRVMAQKMMFEMIELQNKMSQSGANAVSGLVGGVEGNSWMAQQAGTNLAATFLNAFRAKMGEQSPSKEMKYSGLNTVLGFVNEVIRDYGMAESAGEGLADSFLGSFRSTMKGIDAAASLSGTVEGLKASGPSALLQNMVGAIAGNTKAQGSISNVNNFTQNIYAPKQPSRIELYRQTRNLLNYAAGRI